MAAMVSQPEALSMARAIATVLKCMIGAGILTLPYACSRVGLGLALPGLVVVAALNALGIWRVVESKIHLTTHGYGALPEEGRGARVADAEGQSSPAPAPVGRFVDMSPDAKSQAQDDVAIEEGDQPAGHGCEAAKESTGPVPAPPTGHSEDWGLGPATMVAWRTFGHTGRAITAAAMVSAQLGVCICYIDVVVETVFDLLPGSLGDALGERVGAGNVRLVLRIALCGMQSMLCLVRSLRDLAWLSGMALTVYALVIAALIRCGIRALGDGGGASGLASAAPVLWRVRWSGLGAWYGSSIFAFEGITIAQYVFDEMRLTDPWPFLQVLMICYGVCLALYSFVGGFGVIAYGEDVQKVIYLSFPAGSPDVTTAKVVLCFVLVLSYVLQMYPVFAFAESAAFEQDDALVMPTGSGSSRGQRCLWVLLRWGLVVATFIIASLVPDVSQVTDYVGSFSFGAIGFVLPALFHIKAFAKDGLSPLSLAADLVLMASGVVAMVLGLLGG